MSRKILFQSLVLVFVLQGVILADEVLCSKPYEDTCPSTDNFFSCELILCVTNPDPDPEAFPVICPQDATEEVIQEDSEGNPKKYHLGLETVTEPNDPGYFYWWNHETVCSKTRACDEEENCNPSRTCLPHQELLLANLR